MIDLHIWITVIVVVIVAIFALRRYWRLTCTPIKPTEEVSKGFTCGGGGTRSISFYSAAMASVLRRANQFSGRRVHLSDFLNDYVVMNGNSGGSWFISLMVYSKQFYEMLDSAGTGRSIFGDCENFESLDRSKLSICTALEGTGRCMYGEGFNCCCGHGYKPSQNKQICVKCQDPGYFTLTKYLNNCITNTEKLFEVYRDGTVKDYELSEQLTFVVQNMLGLELYSILKLLGGDLGWQDLVRYVIFNSVDDIGTESSINSSPNGFTNIVSWSSSILNNAFTTTNRDSFSAEYDIVERMYEDYGVATPIRVMYDLGTNSGPDRLFFGGGDYNVRYTSNEFMLTRRFGNLPISPLSNVRDICTGSGSAIAGFGSPKLVEEFAEYIRPFIGKFEQIDNFLCLFNPSPTRCGNVALLSKQFSVFGPLLLQEGDNSKIQCDEDEHGLCNRWVPEKEPKEEYEKYAPLRISDGFYGSDDTGIVAGLAEIQHKKPNVKRIKLVSFINYGWSNTDITDDISKRFYKHFGVNSKCLADPNDAPNKVNIGMPGVTFLDLYVSNNKIFESEGCFRETVIFNGRYDDPKKWANDQNCNPITQSCSASVDIFAWNALKTVENKTFNIKPGYVVDLFVVNMRVSFHGAPAFPSPLDLGIPEGSNNFVNVLGDHSHRISKVMEHLPRSVYDVVFGDVPYCPGDFKNKKNKSDNYFK